MNPYKVLEINESADKDTIRKAYRKLARKYHPDSNPGNKAAEEKFKEINDAYTILSDEKKKEEYDNSQKNGTGAFNGKQTTKQRGGNPFRPEDIFFGTFGKNPFGENPFEPHSANTKKETTEFGYGVDKGSVNEQFANFFGFQGRKK